MNDLSIVLILVFIIGYCSIIFESKTGIHKTASALAVGVFSWMLFFIFNAQTVDQKIAELHGHLWEVSQLLFFIMGGMLIVETIDQHGGFEFIGRNLPTHSPVKLFAATSVLTFLISSVLDNLTTLLIFVYIFRKLLPRKSERVFFLAPLVVAANAGGVWTPIGDVTTTMLWIGNKITSLAIIKTLFLPSIVFFIIFSLLYVRCLPKQITVEPVDPSKTKTKGSLFVLVVGFLSLLLVPVWKALFGIPPFLGVMLGLTVLWIMTDLIHGENKESHYLKLNNFLHRADLATILFFFGILLAVDALQSVGVLDVMSKEIFAMTSSISIIAVSLGFLSSLIDNVPLVAACMKMFPSTQFPPDHLFWNMIAFCAGVGGSLLLIGSAPGVALMTLESHEFYWYLKKITLPATIAYLISSYLII